MNAPIFDMLNQLLTNGHTFGQQGIYAEMQGNYVVAAQSYDQSIALIYQSMVMAQQSGVQIPHHIHFTFALAHFSAARAKSVLGWAPVACTHLNQSLVALNQAIAINPNEVQYHAAAGTVLMTLGNFPEAERAFSAALQLNPSDPSSQYMMAVLHSARGNMTAANHHYAAAQQIAPNVPQMPNFPTSATPGQGTDWINTVNNICSLLNNVFKTIGTFQDLRRSF